ncbi:MAG: hypothetical protein ACRD1G_15125, partial [Acidimicrobiales bacterium]
LTLGPGGDQVDFVGVYSTGFSVTVFNEDSSGGLLFWGPVSPNSTLFGPGGSTGYITVTLPANTTAVGFDVMTDPAAQGVTVTLGGGLGTFSGIVTQNNPTEQFWGVTTSTAIASLQVQDPAAGSSIILDNFQYGQSTALDAPPVAEAMTSILLGSGLLMLGGLKRYLPNLMS